MLETGVDFAVPAGRVYQGTNHQAQHRNSGSAGDWQARITCCFQRRRRFESRAAARLIMSGAPPVRFHGAGDVMLMAHGLAVSMRLEPHAGKDDAQHVTLHPHAIEGAANLRIRNNGQVDFQGGKGQWARFVFEPTSANADGSAAYFIRSVGHEDQNLRKVYLQAQPDGSFRAGPIGCPFAIVGDTMPTAPPPRPPDIILTDSQKAAFMQDGYLIVRGVVSQGLVDDALRVINDQLSKEAWQESDQHFGIGKNAHVVDLIRASPALGIAEQLLGAVAQVHKGQVALRFPFPPTKARTKPPKSDNQWHIDGEGQRIDKSGFQLLVGIALSHQPTEECGNLHIWPGHHVTIFEAAQRERALLDSGAVSAAQTLGSDDHWLGQKPHLPPEHRRQVCLNPGDVVMCHQKMPHRIGLNRSPHIRYQVYFRLKAKDYQPDAPLVDVFHGWHGLTGA